MKVSDKARSGDNVYKTSASNMRKKAHGNVAGRWAGEWYDVVNDAISLGGCGISLT